MSYGRDRDAYTRGVGAIAAADFKNPARQARRRQQARALRERDGALSRYTLGTIAKMDANTNWATDSVLPPPVTTGDPLAPGPKTRTAMGRGTIAINPFTGQPYTAPAPTTDVPTRGSAMTSTSSSTPPSSRDPYGRPPPTNAGAGAGIQSGGTQPTTDLLPLPPTDDFVPAPTTWIQRNRRPLIYAAIAGGVYLLFRKKKGG